MGASIVSGILNLDKPRGWTSHDVVARVRSLTRQRRVGHAGTLDPLATGVLLLCVGQATRVSEYLMAGQKRYRATLRLGVSTDTYDADGTVTEDSGVVDLSLAQIADALEPFRGQVVQTPPMYSAVKVNGQQLFRQARRGVTIERPTRTVEIERLDVLDWQSPLLTVEITCSPGTYIRSLAHDLGQRLGCGAHVAALTRLASGRFDLSAAISLEAFAEAVTAGDWQRLLHPVEAALVDLPVIEADEALIERLRHGLPIPCLAPPRSHLGRVRGPDDALVAIVAHDPDTAQWRPRKVFQGT